MLPAVFGIVDNTEEADKSVGCNGDEIMFQPAVNEILQVGSVTFQIHVCISAPFGFTAIAEMLCSPATSACSVQLASVTLSFVNRRDSFRYQLTFTV